MRTAQTEFTHVRQAFLLEALANTGVAFVLRADDEEVHNLPAARDLLERSATSTAKRSPPICGRCSSATAAEIGGFAACRSLSRLDREWQVMFINGRPSGSPVLTAVQSAYRSVLLADGLHRCFCRYPCRRTWWT